MAEADIEIAGDADIGVEEDEEEREILSDTSLEGLSEDPEEVGGLLARDGFDNPEERIADRGDKKEDEGQGLFESKNNREIVRRSGV